MRPVPFLEAFRSESPEALMSQAAILIGLRYRLWPYAAPSGQTIAASDRRIEFSEVLTAEEASALKIPRIGELKERISGAFHRDVLGRFERLTGRPFGLRSFDAKEPAPVRIARLAERLEKEPDPVEAAGLMLACFEHPHALVRAAAAGAYGQLYATFDFVREVLSDATRDESPLVRAVAATGLAQIDPDHPALHALRSARRSPFGGSPDRTSMLIHGTFARTETWWQPRPEYNFHAYIKAQVRPDLYSASDRFEWTGGYSDSDREDGARELADWVTSHNEQGIVLLGHSHGANVMLRATHYGLQSEKLVLLSCPVHMPKYEPVWSNVGEIVSVRVKADVVIMLDGGGQRFRDSRIRENVLGVWFNHSATHDPDVWRREGVPSKI